MRNLSKEERECEVEGEGEVASTKRWTCSGDPSITRSELSMMSLTAESESMVMRKVAERELAKRSFLIRYLPPVTCGTKSEGRLDLTKLRASSAEIAREGETWVGSFFTHTPSVGEERRGCVGPGRGLPIGPVWWGCFSGRAALAFAH